MRCRKRDVCNDITQLRDYIQTGRKLCGAENVTLAMTERVQKTWYQVLTSRNSENVMSHWHHAVQKKCDVCIKTTRRPLNSKVKMTNVTSPYRQQSADGSAAGIHKIFWIFLKVSALSLPLSVAHIFSLLFYSKVFIWQSLQNVLEFF